MPKKNGKVKTFSFNDTTLKQIKFLSDFYMLKHTNLIEFLVNEKYKECKGVVAYAKEVDVK